MRYYILKSTQNWIIHVYNVITITSHWDNHRLWTAPCLSLYVMFPCVHPYTHNILTQNEWALQTRPMWPADVTVGSLLKGISGNERGCEEPGCQIGSDFPPNLATLCQPCQEGIRGSSDVCFKEVRKAGLQPLLILIEVFIRHPDKSIALRCLARNREGDKR